MRQKCEENWGSCELFSIEFIFKYGEAWKHWKHERIEWKKLKQFDNQPFFISSKELPKFFKFCKKSPIFFRFIHFLNLIVKKLLNSPIISDLKTNSSRQIQKFCHHDHNLDRFELLQIPNNSYPVKSKQTKTDILQSCHAQYSK